MKKTPSKSSKHLRAFKSLTIRASLSLLLSLHGRDIWKTCCSDTFLSITVPLYDLLLLALNVDIMCFPAACVPAMFLKRYTVLKSLWFLIGSASVAFFFVDGRKYSWTGYQHRLGLYSSHLNITSLKNKNRLFYTHKHTRHAVIYSHTSLFQKSLLVLLKPFCLYSELILL